MNNLKDKKILITAGPSWVPIDKVRVITNIFSGNLGLLIATKSLRYSDKITLLLGPGKVFVPKMYQKKIRIIRYKYYDDLLKIIGSEIKKNKFDIIIHSSAISDYKPINVYDGKIKSGKDKLFIELVPTKKIIDLIRRKQPAAFLVKFKLEVNQNKKDLINIAFTSMLQSGANLIVANDYKTVFKNHKAYIIDLNKNIISVEGKNKIATTLLKIINNNFS